MSKFHFVTHSESILFCTTECQPSSVVPCPVVWCGVVWCGVVWCRVVSCLVVWCGVVSCRVASRRVVSCRVVSCHCLDLVLCTFCHAPLQMTGVGNTARLISICIEMLARNPSYQTHILEEMHRVCGGRSAKEVYSS
jgi:hypothetical protein